MTIIDYWIGDEWYLFGDLDLVMLSSSPFLRNLGEWHIVVNVQLVASLDSSSSHSLLFFHHIISFFRHDSHYQSVPSRVNSNVFRLFRCCCCYTISLFDLFRPPSNLSTDHLHRLQYHTPHLIKHHHSATTCGNKQKNIIWKTWLVYAQREVF